MRHIKRAYPDSASVDQRSACERDSGPTESDGGTFWQSCVDCRLMLKRILKRRVRFLLGTVMGSVTC
jgi:hypothetical protein